MKHLLLLGASLFAFPFKNYCRKPETKMALGNINSFHERVVKTIK